jgi:ATP-dependent Lhr-like helicase
MKAEFSNSRRIIEKWFESKKWKPFEFQVEAWDRYIEGKSGLIHSSTGSGKTFGILLGEVIKALEEGSRNESGDAAPRKNYEPLTIIWITPLRALALDTFNTIKKLIEELNLNWSIELRTGDTDTNTRRRQKTKLPTLLITTPESLSILHSYENSDRLFETLKSVIIDEWHELMGSKRGVMTELLLARLKRHNPDLSVWGLSATLGNLQTALSTLLGSSSDNGIIIEGKVDRVVEIKTLLPDKIDRFPWAGHLGINMLEGVIQVISDYRTSLLFTNTRSQAEIWFNSILNRRPDWAGIIALHHGSLDKKQRLAVEGLLREGKLKCVVCTSSLDLGVDYSPVEVVLQVGSPKGIARLLQRAGRSGHSPGRKSRVYCVPTNSFELIEFSAAKKGIAGSFIEDRNPYRLSLDVLVQHVVTLASGSGFEAEQMFEEIRTTHAFKHITDEEWKWVLDFITRGGPSLKAYEDFKRVIEESGRYKMKDKNLVKKHRLSIGTISSDTQLIVKFLNGGRLGSIEENFISKLKKGDTFIFSGRSLEFVTLKDMTVYVRRSSNSKGPIPQWMGGRMPLSTQLAELVRERFTELKSGKIVDEELKILKPLIELQRSWSELPDSSKLLIERIKTREGYHLFVYPFEGKLVHEGLASLIGYRISKIKDITFSAATNDYGFELLSDQPIPLGSDNIRKIFTADNLLDDILDSLNMSEMAKRQFRDIARISGLIFQGYPGSRKRAGQLQASSGLFYEVFKKFDSGNLLLRQASNEVLQNQLEHKRIKETLYRIQKLEIKLVDLPYITPLAFPLLVNRLRERMSSEKLIQRVSRMTLQLEKHADRTIKSK